MATNPFNDPSRPVPKANPFDASPGGVVLNTIKGIPQAAASGLRSIVSSVAPEAIHAYDAVTAASQQRSLQPLRDFATGYETRQKEADARTIPAPTDTPAQRQEKSKNVALMALGGEGNAASDASQAIRSIAKSTNPAEISGLIKQAFPKLATNAETLAQKLRAISKPADVEALIKNETRVAAAPKLAQQNPFNAPEVPAEAHVDWKQNVSPKWGQLYDEIASLRKRLDTARGSKEIHLSRRYDTLLDRSGKLVDDWANRWGIDAKEPVVQQKLFTDEERSALPPRLASSPEAAAAKTSRSQVPREAAPEKQPPLPKTVGDYLASGERYPQSRAELNTSREAAFRESPPNPREIEANAALGNSIRQNVKDGGSKVHILDYIRTPEYVLEKLGLGNEAKILRGAYEGYQQELPKEIDRITQWHDAVKANPASSQRIFKWLDGQSQTLTDGESKVAGEIKTYLRGWADRLGLPRDQRVAHYITHIFERDFIQKDFDPDLAKLIADKVPGSVYDPFLEKRLGAAGYKEDAFAALDAYVKRAVRKAHMDPALESLEKAAHRLDLESYKYIQRYASRVNMRPTETENLLDNLIKSVAGYKFGQRPVAFLSRAARQIVYRGTLGLNIGSAVRNLTQGVNTYAKLGERYTIVGYSKLISRMATNNLDELEKSGVLGQDLVQDRTIGVYKKALQKVDKGLFAFFEVAEKINRGAAYFGAKSKAIAGGKTEEQAIEYAKRVVRETQFSFSSIDTPVAMNDDVVKFLTQLQSFNIKQTEFLGGMVKNKEWAGLIRFIAGSFVMVHTIGKLVGMKPQDLIPTVRLGGSPIPSEVGAGLSLATARTDQQKSDAQKQLTSGMFAFIPAGVQGRKTAQGAVALAQGETKTPTGRTRFKVPSDPTTAIRALLFGPNNLPQAQEYFDSIGKKKPAAAGSNPFNN